jgi:hypothetical protein
MAHSVTTNNFIARACHAPPSVGTGAGRHGLRNRNLNPPSSPLNLRGEQWGVTLIKGGKRGVILAYSLHTKKPEQIHSLAWIDPGFLVPCPVRKGTALEFLTG